MKILEKEFIGTGEVRGWKFKQIACSPYAHVYEITTLEGNMHYETFEMRKQEKRDYEIAGKWIHCEEKILYPTSNDIGVWGWCITNLDRAIQKFNELNNDRNNELNELNTTQVTDLIPVLTTHKDEAQQLYINFDLC